MSNLIREALEAALAELAECSKAVQVQERVREALASLDAAPMKGEVVAWEARDENPPPDWWEGAYLISASEHERLLTLGGAIPRVARECFRPLYAHPAVAAPFRADNGTAAFDWWWEKVGDKFPPEAKEEMHTAWRAFLRVLRFAQGRPPLDPYDQAISDLAKYLPDGWVAQDRNGRSDVYPSKPLMFEHSNDWGPGNPSVHTWNMPVTLPKATDWRASLRRIIGGRVVDSNGGAA